MKPISPFGLPIGISVAFWLTVGIIRFLYERAKLDRFVKKQKRSPDFKISDIGVIMSAHNEELVIRDSIRSLKQSFSPKQIYIASDGSADKTYRRAQMEGCHVSELNPGRGKGKALVYLLRRYRLFERYKLIFIIDADTRIGKDYPKRALTLFRDPQVSVMFSSSQIIWPRHIFPKRRLYFVSYRDRLNRLLVYFFIYGQTWKYTNVNYVIPGFCTIYKSKVLRQLKIDTPGLLIEDFNLAFQFHKKKLGKIAYDPTLSALEQYPDNLKDYWNQVRRWNIGFFQTVRINGIWPSFFWISVGVFSLEVIISSFYVLFIPFVIFFEVLSFLSDNSQLVNVVLNLRPPFLDGPLSSILIGFFLFDYIITIIIATIHKKPQFLIYGLAFFFMHYVTSLILFSSFIPGFFSKSEGRWTSPKRRVVTENIAKS